MWCLQSKECSKNYTIYFGGVFYEYITKSLSKYTRIVLIILGKNILNGGDFRGR